MKLCCTALICSLALVPFVVLGQGPAAPPAPEIRDIAPPVDVFPYPIWVVVLAVLAALVVLGLVVWLIVRAVRRRPAPLPPSPRSVALRELEALRPTVETSEPYDFSIAVSDVLRRYIGAAFGLKAPQQTSPEFLAAVAASKRFAQGERELLETFLERCDLIKFAPDQCRRWRQP
jgi:hypothetical protein